MLSLGQDLYQESQRDLVGVQLESFFRQTSAPLGIGIASAQLFVSTPPDRLLWIHSYSFDGQAGAAAARWLNAQLELIAPDTGTGVICTLATKRNAFGISCDGEAPSNLIGYTVGLGGGLLLPRGISLRMTAQRSDTTVAGSAVLTVLGYLVPPGNVARGA